MATDKSDERKIARNFLERAENRKHYKDGVAGGRLTDGMREDLRKRLELLTHQISFFSNRIYEAVRKNAIVPPKSPTPSSPAKDLDILVELSCDLLDINEHILYSKRQQPK